MTPPSSSLNCAIQIKPQAEYFLNLGHTYFKQGKMDKAAEQYRKVLRIDPHTSGAHFSLGNIAVERGSYEEGIGHLRLR